MGQIRDFSGQNLVHFGSPSQNVLNSDLKNPGFVPFEAIWSNFVTHKLDIHGKSVGNWERDI